MKKLLIVLTLLATFLLSGCGEHYPEVRIDVGLTKSYREICIGAPYKYDGFDISNADSGKDLIIHFIKGAEE